MRQDVEIAEAIENIDIGGSSMLHNATKNHEFVIAAADPSDYEEILSKLRQYRHTSLSFRQKLAAKVFRHTAVYDALIAQYLTDQVEEREPGKLILTYERKQTLRCGENNHQAAAFYQSALLEKYSITVAKQLYGKELSYNNIRDVDAALRVMRKYDEPTVIVLKHMNPCDIGPTSTILEAWEAAYEADPVSIFGGIIVSNRKADLLTTEQMRKLSLEIIIAPSYTQEASRLLQRKKNIRLLTIDFVQEKG